MNGETGERGESGPEAEAHQIIEEARAETTRLETEPGDREDVVIINLANASEDTKGLVLAEMGIDSKKDVPFGGDLMAEKPLLSAQMEGKDSMFFRGKNLGREVMLYGVAERMPESRQGRGELRPETFVPQAIIISRPEVMKEESTPGRLFHKQEGVRERLLRSQAVFLAQGAKKLIASGEHRAVQQIELD